MPGSVSDSYDPEFGTGANADEVKEAMRRVVTYIGCYIGVELHNIVGVVQGPSGGSGRANFSERDLRIIRFALNRAIETI